MPLYTKESLQRLKEKVDLVEVLSQHLDLQLSGQHYRTRCPFHDERSPSFMIKTGAFSYHCFGCGAHGDAISFLMQYAHFSFREAVEFLADRFHVALDLAMTQPDSSEGRDIYQRKTLLRQVLAYAAEVYHKMLIHSECAAGAREYLLGRGMTIPFMMQFNLGFAPPKREFLEPLVKKKGWDTALLVEAGLSNQRGGDFFSGRILFPICEVSGSVVGFSGRSLEKEPTQGKYVNTKETLLFKKSKILFGLNYSYKQIVKKKQILLVEGQCDALSLIYHGFDFTVAIQGTAFGKEQQDLLQQLSVKTCYLALDGDSAGRASTLKIGHELLKAGCTVFVLPMEVGEDPDMIIQKGGKDAFTLRVEAAQEFSVFLVEYMGKEFSHKGSKGSAHNPEIAEKCFAFVNQWKSRAMQQRALEVITIFLQIPPNTFSLSPYSSKVCKKLSKPTFTENNIFLQSEQRLLWYLLQAFERSEREHLYYLAEINLTSWAFPGERLHQKIFALLMQSYQAGEFLTVTDLLNSVDDEQDREKVESLVSASFPMKHPEQEFIKQLKWMFASKYKEALTAEARRLAVVSAQGQDVDFKTISILEQKVDLGKLAEMYDDGVKIGL